MPFTIKYLSPGAIFPPGEVFAAWQREMIVGGSHGPTGFKLGHPTHSDGNPYDLHPVQWVLPVKLTKWHGLNDLNPLSIDSLLQTLVQDHLPAMSVTVDKAQAGGKNPEGYRDPNDVEALEQTWLILRKDCIKFAEILTTIENRIPIERRHLLLENSHNDPP